MKRPLIYSILAAFAFIIHASFNDVHSWPLVWPLLAGVLSVTAGKRNAAYRYRALIRVGISAALVVFSAGLAVSWFTEDATLISHFQQFNNPPDAEPSLVFGICVLAAVFFAAWLLSSGITALITRKKEPVTRW
ncbi:hypothetical protein [Sediminibacterium ginsengisoli]|uniref:Transmembrane family 220, helix n=1 Tax=Sediminibacterium ginsengisoli TaxID=413434 RepID=A0A1T4RHN5_9BACT|nr:hypothetical protein [Sediminibacterium ginsengisoli]SKA15514.1 hypothetical protein SAMN04488132_11298 [Sediminibacterium ginsengisoli]